MGIPNYSVTQNEIAEEKRLQEEAVKRQRLEQSLEKGLDALERDLETLPAPDATNVRQP